MCFNLKDFKVPVKLAGQAFPSIEDCRNVWGPLALLMAETWNVRWRCVIDNKCLQLRHLPESVKGGVKLPMDWNGFFLASFPWFKMFLTTCSIFISASIFDQWCICEFLQDLQKRICRIRELYQSQVKEGKSKGRLVPDDEKLMWEVFRHHPYATERLMGATYIQVGQSSKSSDPNHCGFFIMRNDEDGDAISYVKCLRCLADAEHGRQNTEQVLSLASISLGKALQLDINGDRKSVV